MFTKLNCSLFLVLFFYVSTSAQTRLNGMYFQWGYNKEWYSRSNIHFKMSNGNDFTIYKAKAHDKTNFNAIISSPIDITIPQYNLRIGFYLNNAKTRGVEINFDHTKYVVTDDQKVRVKGVIDGKQVDNDTILDRNSFLHFEHTDGANFLHINYFQMNSLKKHRSKDRDVFSSIWKVGAGCNIPRTDFTWHGKRLNNKFHVAGYNVSAEGGARWNMSKNFFLEGTGKVGYVRYVDALADTPDEKGNRAHHGFGYFECIGTLGYNISFVKTKVDPGK